jgi:flagellar motility protein MotE (MotC chaperone)
MVPKTTQFSTFLLAISLLVSGEVIATEKKPVNVQEKEIEIAASLKIREKAVAAREKELDKKQKDYNEIKKDVDEKLKQLKALQKDLESKLAEMKQRKDKSFKNLLKVYAAMSATKLAPILNKMDDKDVTDILRGLKTDQVSKIIPKLNQDKAVRVSLKLGRIKLKSE